MMKERERDGWRKGKKDRGGAVRWSREERLTI